MAQQQQRVKGSKLQDILTERGLTQQDFAATLYEKTGFFISPQHLSNFCTGYRQLKKLDMAMAFAQTLEVDVTAIVE
jgi:transcriptional regulator with XRE-family HTH domain